MLTVRQGDTHDVYWKLYDLGDGTLPPVEIDLEDATAELHIKPKTGTVISINLIVEESENRLRHTLTGTLPVGIHKYEIEITKDGQISTAPTGQDDLIQVIAQIA